MLSPSIRDLRHNFTFLKFKICFKCSTASLNAHPQPYFEVHHQRLLGPDAYRLSAVEIIPHARIQVDTDLVGNQEFDTDTCSDRPLHALHLFRVAEIALRFLYPVDVCQGFFRLTSGIGVESESRTFDDVIVSVERDAHVVYSVSDVRSSSRYLSVLYIDISS